MYFKPKPDASRRTYYRMYYRKNRSTILMRSKSYPHRQSHEQVSQKFLVYLAMKRKEFETDILLSFD